MKRKAPEEPSPPAMMMTPMVDVVFQLIIFFILVLDFIQVVIEKMELPVADRLKELRYADDILVVNILKSGMYKINGRVYYDPDRVSDGAAERTAFLKLKELFTRRRMRQQGPDGFVNTMLVIRADRSTDFEAVQRLVMMSAKYGGVTRLAFSARPSEG